MDLHRWLANRLNRPPDISGLVLVFKCLATGIAILLLMVPLVWLFPSQRHNAITIAPVLVGLGVGFVYGCSGGPAAWLFGFAVIFRAAIWHKGQPFIRNLEYVVLYVTVSYVGFALSYLVGCRRRVQPDRDS